MARKLSTQLRFNGKLHTLSPLHCGGIADDNQAAMSLAVDGGNQYYIPGTELAGVLRSWTEQHFPAEQDITKCLWGFQDPTANTSDKAAGQASRIIVENARIEIPGGQPAEIWDGIGIDRRWGRAADQMKFDYAVLPRGTLVYFELTVDLPTNIDLAQKCRVLLKHLFKALSSGDINIGSSASRGLGVIQLQQLKLEEINWQSNASVLAHLGIDTASTTSNKKSAEDAAKVYMQTTDEDQDLRPIHPEILDISIDWAPQGALMSKSGYDGIVVDMLPLVSLTNSTHLSMVLPGESIKGALRNQAERIVRTVLQRYKVNPDWAQQIEEPLVTELFGSAKQKTQAQNSVGMQAALHAQCCYAENFQCSTQLWDQVVTATESFHNNNTNTLYAHLSRIAGTKSTKPYIEQAYHVAVDRWTGGVLEGALYSAIEPFNVTWEPLRLRLHLNRVSEKEEVLTLLLLLLRDLSQQRITLGFGANRGYGEIKVTGLEIKRQGSDSNLDWMNNLKLQGSFNFEQLPTQAQKSMENMQHAWSTWIEKHKEHAA